MSDGTRRTAAIAVGLFLFAFLFRLVGIQWGLKNDLHHQSYHPDEPVVLGYALQLNPIQGDFTPNFYNYGTFYLSAVRVLADMTSAYTGGPDVRNPESYWAWCSRVHLAGRLLNAAAGAGTAVVLFLFMAGAWGWVSGVFAGLLVAVAPGFVVHSRFQTVDVFAVFWLALAAYWALRMVQDPERQMRWALMSGLAGGLSAGTKYTGILILAVPLVLLAMHKPVAWAKLAAAVLGMAALGFLIGTPGALLEPDAFRRDVMYEIDHTATGHGLIFTATSPGFVYHLSNLMMSIGPLLTVIGLGGLLWGAFDRKPFAVALLVFFLLTYFVIGRAEVKFLRYTFPLIVPLAAGFGYAMVQAHQRGVWGRVVVALGLAGLGGLDPGGMRQAVQYSLWMAETDPRDKAVRTFAPGDEANPFVAYASDPWYYSAPFFKDSAAVRAVPLATRLEEMRKVERPRVTFYVPAEGDPFAFDERLLTEVRPDYVTFSSFEYFDPNRLRNVPNLLPEEKIQVERYVAFEKRLVEEYELVATHGGGPPLAHDLEYIRPTVVMWKRRTP